MRIVAINILFFITTICTNAQQVLVKQWDKRFGGTNSDYLWFAQKNADGSYILSGSSNSSISGDKTQPNWDTTFATTDAWIVKIDSSGNKLWDKRFGGFGSDGCQAIATLDGGYILGCGSTSGVGGDKSEPYRGQADYWLVKIDSIGNKQWDKCFGGLLMDNSANVYQTRDSSYIMGGYSNSPISGDKTQDAWDSTHFHYDYWLVKTDALGNKQWDKRFGGEGQEIGGMVVQTHDGGYLVGGSSASDISGDKTQGNWASQHYNYWVVRIDPLGNKLWDKRYGGTSGDYGCLIIPLHDGSFILGGYSDSNIGGDKTQNSHGGEDYWIIKIDSLGNKLWDKDYGGDANDELYTLELTHGGGYLLAGASGSSASGDKSENNLGTVQVWLVKTDSLGNKQWGKTVLTGGYDAYTGIAFQTTDDCYMVGVNTKAGLGGYKTQPNWDPTNATDDYWIIKFCDSTLTAIEEPPTAQAQIQIYPNPFSTDLNIFLQQPQVSPEGEI